MSFGGLQTSLRAFCSLPSPCDAGKATRWHTRPAQQSPQVFHVTASFQKGNLGITKHYSAMDPLGVVLELLLGAVGKNRNFSPFAESQPSLSPLGSWSVLAVCNGDIRQCWVCNCSANRFPLRSTSVPWCSSALLGVGRCSSNWVVGVDSTERGTKPSQVLGYYTRCSGGGQYHVCLYLGTTMVLWGV